MWFAGTIAAMSSITYPAISAFVSAHAEADQQGKIRYGYINSLYYHDEGHCFSGTGRYIKYLKLTPVL
jgi:hypothetical protein